MVKVIFVGMGGGAFAARQLKELIESLGMSLTIMTEWSDADIQWNKDTYLDEVKKYDIVICPIDYFRQPYKANNKLTQFMSLGKPIISSPSQAYKEVIKNGWNGYIADNLEDWKKYLTLLRDDEALRKKVGENALKSVSENYSVEKTVDKLIENFSVAENTIDFIIPNYNNTKYLELTVKSLHENTKNPFVVHLVDSGTQDVQSVLDYMEKNGVKYTFKKFNERTCFSKQVNWGIEHSSNNIIVIGNNDLVFTKDWDVPLVNRIKVDPHVMVQPLSNCDKYWLHKIDLKTNKGVSLEPGVHNIDTFDLEDFYVSQDNFKKNETHTRDKLAFYCTMFDRRLIHRVGLLDETFLNGGEDFCFCYRAKKAGWKFESIYNSFVLHFGGKTRKVNENENYERHHQEDKFNNSRLNKKLSKSMLVFYLGAGWERWDETNLITGGIGGSETAAIWMAREMSKIGYQVKVFADPAQDHMDMSGDDVEYIHWTKYDKFAKSTYIDFLISSRTTDPLGVFHHAYRKYVWIHDIFINGNKNYNCHVDKVNYFLTLSDWHKDFVHDHHGIPKDKILVTANGIDPTRYKRVNEIQKVPGQIIYSSSPDRGLDTLLYCSDFIKQYVPNLKIIVAYGFSNWQRAVQWRNDPNEINYMNRIKEMLKKPYVEYVGRIDQKRLAELQMQSSGWFQPTRFTETFCITAAENGFAKNPILASKLAGLTTTVGDNGILLDGDAYTVEYRQKFIEQAVKLLTEKDYWNYWSEKSYNQMRKFTWANVAKQWHKLFQDNVFERL